MIENQGASVLVVEDDAFLNASIAKQLTRLGYTLSGCAYDAREAVELVHRKQPQVVLMDLQMIDPETGREDMSAGLKAASAIQQTCPTLVIALSAHESPDLIVRAGDAGIGAYLVKPASDGDLRRAITIASRRFSDLEKLKRPALAARSQDHEFSQAGYHSKSSEPLLHACAGCRRIRDQRGAWQAMEVYFTEQFQVRFSHGFCPECSLRLYPEVFSKSLPLEDVG